MENIVLTVHLILALLLIGVVLLQRSEGGGLGMGSSGGGAMSSRGLATALTKLTWIFAIGFIITSISLTIIAAKNSAGSSVIDQINGIAPAATPVVPASPLGENLLPPSATDAPATPPRADAGTAPAADGTTAPAADTTAPAAPAPAPAAPASN